MIGFVTIRASARPVNPPDPRAQVIYRGCILSNTKWVIGLVVFTGASPGVSILACVAEIGAVTLDGWWLEAGILGGGEFACGLEPPPPPPSSRSPPCPLRLPGMQTKYMMNATEKHIKRTTLDKLTAQALLVQEFMLLTGGKAKVIGSVRSHACLPPSHGNVVPTPKASADVDGYFLGE